MRDKSSNIHTRYNDLKGVGDHDFEFTIDDLHRVQEAQRGNAQEIGESASFTHVAGSQKWTFDILGNWAMIESDNNGDGDYGDTNEDKARTHNSANELTVLDVGGDDLALTYDDAGNLRQRNLPDKGPNSFFYRYTHDAWGRLVEVEYVVDNGSETAYTIAEHTYNGLSWRIKSSFDTSSPFDGDADERRYMYYNASWQLIEEFDAGDFLYIGDERRREYFYSADYIDAAYLIRESNDLTNDSPDITYEEIYYLLCDAHYNPMVVLDDAATVIERVDYSSYGTPRHHYRADLDGDSAVIRASASFVRTYRRTVCAYGRAVRTSGNSMCAIEPIVIADVGVIRAFRIVVSTSEHADCAFGRINGLHDQAAGSLRR